MDRDTGHGRGAAAEKEIAAAVDQRSFLMADGRRARLLTPPLFSRPAREKRETSAYGVPGGSMPFLATGTQSLRLLVTSTFSRGRPIETSKGLMCDSVRFWPSDAPVAG